MLRFRVRGPNGVSNLSLPRDTTVAGLKSSIAASTGLQGFDLKCGFPPQLLPLEQFGDGVELSKTGIRIDGQQLIATERHTAAKPSSSIAKPQEQDGGDTMGLEYATQTSKRHSPPTLEPTASQPAPFSPSSTVVLHPPLPSSPPLPLEHSSTADLDPPEVPLPALASTLVLRVMPDDNSCLFRALSSAVLGSNLDSMTELRSMVAQVIQSDPETYNAAVLDRSPDAYCRWIQREDSWGGAIELKILAEHFDIEICSIDVQSLRIDSFNESKSSRVILVYSGIHYDVIAVSPSEPPHTKADVPAEFDIKVFEGDDKEPVLAGALELCKILQGRHYYTDTSGFTIKCNVCGWSGTGEKGATEHAKETGHMNFGEAE